MVSDKAALIANIMSGYDIYISKWIDHEIRDRAISTDIVQIFPYLLTQICMEAGVQELPNINLFLGSRTMNDLGLIIDINNLISKMENLGALIISEAYGAGGDDTTGYTDIGDTLTKTSQSTTQDFDAAGTSSTPTPLPTTAP